jgi:cytidylate kinase
MSKIFREIHIEKQIARHMQRWEQRREERRSQVQPSLRRPAEPFGPYISISREVGSGGNELAAALAEKLHWHLYDREILEAIASRIFTNQILDNTQYLHHLTRVLLSIAQYGEAVIVGRGAHLILPAESGVRVRIVAPLTARIQRFMQQHGCVEKRAAELLAERDKDQSEFLQRHFRSKPDDPRAYDVVLNAENLSVTTAATLITTLAEEKLKISLSSRRDMDVQDLGKS